MSWWNNFEPHGSPKSGMCLFYKNVLPVRVGANIFLRLGSVFEIDWVSFYKVSWVERSSWLKRYLNSLFRATYTVIIHGKDRRMSKSCARFTTTLRVKYIGIAINVIPGIFLRASLVAPHMQGNDASIHTEQRLPRPILRELSANIPYSIVYAVK